MPSFLFIHWKNAKQLTETTSVRSFDAFIREGLINKWLKQKTIANLIKQKNWTENSNQIFSKSATLSRYVLFNPLQSTTIQILPKQ